jgi:hypothetical protein
MSQMGTMMLVKENGKIEMRLHHGVPPLWLINEMAKTKMSLHPWWKYWNGERVSVMRAALDLSRDGDPLNATATEWLALSRGDARNRSGRQQSVHGPIIILTGGCLYDTSE